MSKTTQELRRSKVPPRLKLTPESIVTAGLEVAATTNCRVFSAKELGQRLGADPTSIYRHFKNKAHLLEMMLDKLHARCAAAVSAPPEDWRNRLRQLADATLEEFCAHPAIIMELTTLTTHGPGEADAVELILGAFSQADMDSSEIVRHYALYSLHVLSSASAIARRWSDAQGEAHGESSDETRAWFAEPHSLNPRKHPRTMELSSQILQLDERDLFQRGVEAVLQSAEATGQQGAK